MPVTDAQNQWIKTLSGGAVDPKTFPAAKGGEKPENTPTKEKTASVGEPTSKNIKTMVTAQVPPEDSG